MRGYARRGFPAVKVKVGSREPGRDLERLARVRDAVGPQVRVMMDANQGMSVDAALALALAARTLDIAWFEEPIDHRDFDGYASLRSRAGIPIGVRRCASSTQQASNNALRPARHRRECPGSANRP